jgi:hypothetical protein
MKSRVETRGSRELFLFSTTDGSRQEDNEFPDKAAQVSSVQVWNDRGRVLTFTPAVAESPPVISTSRAADASPLARITHELFP